MGCRHLRPDPRGAPRDDREREADRVDAEVDAARAEKAAAATSSPIITGTIGCSPGRTSKPSSVMRARKCAVFSRSRSRSSADVSISSSARERSPRRPAGRRCSRRGTGRERWRRSSTISRAARDVAAARAAERLAERAGDDVDALDHAVVLGRAAAAGADEADRVRVVDHHQRVVALGELADPVELARGSRPSRRRRRSRSAGGARRRPPRAAPRARPCRRSRSGAGAPCRAGCRR